MKADTDARWRALQALALDDIDAAFPFSARLARDNGWSVAFAQRVIEEYKRFAFLCVAGNREMTPSDEVDQAWHLHLTYTRHYWGPFSEALGASLHHGPTKGGAVEQSRYTDNYRATKTAYREYFGEAPPRDIWPTEKMRFGDAPYMQRVNRKRHYVIPKFAVMATASLATAFGAVIASVSAQSGPESAGGLVDQIKERPVLFAAAILLFVISVFAMFRRGKNRSARKGATGGAAGCGGGGSGSGKSGDGGCSGDGGSSGCGGGCGGCGG